MRLARFRGGAAAALAAVFLALPQAQAAPVLDQAVNGPLTGAGGFIRDGGIDIAQTFTVGVSGRLSRLEFSIGRTADTTTALTVEIRSVTGGVPDALGSSVLLSTSVSASEVQVIGATTAGPFDFSNFAFVGVDIGALGLDVSAGDTYAIALRSEAATGGYGWAFVAPDPYAGGHGFFRANNPGTGVWQRGGADQIFRTFVGTVPEPGTLALVSLALLGLAGRRLHTKTATRAV